MSDALLDLVRDRLESLREDLPAKAQAFGWVAQGMAEDLARVARESADHPERGEYLLVELEAQARALAEAARIEIEETTWGVVWSALQEGVRWAALALRAAASGGV